MWNNNFPEIVSRSFVLIHDSRVFRVGRAIHRAPFEIYNTQCARSFHYLGSEARTSGEERKENLRATSRHFFPPFFSSLPFPPPPSSSSEKRSHVCCRSGTNGLGTFSYGIVFHGWLLLMPNFRFIRRPRKGVRFCSPPVKAAGQLHANPCGFPRVIHHQTSIALSPLPPYPYAKA